MNEFDKHPKIKYKSITQLFWNKYPYRIVIKYTKPYPYWMTSNYANYDEWRKTIDTYLVARRKFVSEIEKHCPQTETWRMSMFGSKGNFNYYFANKDEAQNFIDNNSNFVSKVFRPEKESHLQKLSEVSDKKYKKVIRDRLYWDRYKYCIEFKSNYKVGGYDEIDEHITTVTFRRKDKRIFYYPYSDRRRLYLARESDIFQVQLIFQDRISNVFEVHIKDHI